MTVPRLSSFEESMSLLVLSIGLIEKCPPRSKDDLTRLDLLVSRLDTAATRANRAIKLMENTL